MLTKRANSAKRADIFISMVGSKESGPFGGNHGHKTAQHRAQFCAQFGANERNFKEYPSWVCQPFQPTFKLRAPSCKTRSNLAAAQKFRKCAHFHISKRTESCVDVRGVYIFIIICVSHHILLIPVKFHSIPRLYIYGYGSIPINTIFSGMNIHLPAILM